MNDPFPMIDPRVQGVREQHLRAKWFLELADQAKDETQKFRFLIAATYFARAVAELLLDAAEKQCLRSFRDKDEKLCRKNCEGQISGKLSHYNLVEKIRIHDFHRFGCAPPDPNLRQVFLGGMMKLTASKGAATLTISPTGPQVTTTGSSSSKDQRSLCSADGSFFDDVSGKYIPLRQILADYLTGMPVVIDWFEKEMM